MSLIESCTGTNTCPHPRPSSHLLSPSHPTPLLFLTLSPSPPHPRNSHSHPQPSPQMIAAMPVPKTIITYQIKLKNRTVKIHQRNKHSIRQHITQWQSQTVQCNVTLIQRFILFSNVRASYITFTATAVLPQIAKPLPRYYREACPIPANTAVFHVQCIPITAVKPHPRAALYSMRSSSVRIAVRPILLYDSNNSSVESSDCQRL